MISDFGARESWVNTDIDTCYLDNFGQVILYKLLVYLQN